VARCFCTTNSRSGPFGLPACGSGVFAKSRLRSYSRSERARSLVAAILHPFRRGVLGFDPLVLSDAAPGAGLVGAESTPVRTSDEARSSGLAGCRVDALALTPCHVVLPSFVSRLLVA